MVLVHPVKSITLIWLKNLFFIIVSSLRSTVQLLWNFFLSFILAHTHRRKPKGTLVIWHRGSLGFFFCSLVDMESFYLTLGMDRDVNSYPYSWIIFLLRICFFLSFLFFNLFIYFFYVFCDAIRYYVLNFLFLFPWCRMLWSILNVKPLSEITHHL